jgi:Spy/CpxP family protein refolding chaperone
MKKFPLVLYFLIVVAGCGPRYIYPHLNWLVPWYVSDYISLDDTQKNMLQKRLLKQLDWHCRTQLPTYAETLRAIGRDLGKADQPVNYAKIQSYNIKLMELWKGLMKQIGPDIADILITASNEQIDELFDNLVKQNQEVREEYIDLPARKMIENRQKRMNKRLKYWISNLTAEQKAAISTWSKQTVPISEEWLQNREMLQDKARRLLARRNSSPDFRADLLKFMVNPELFRTPAYQAKIETNIDITIKLIIQLDRLLTPKQRSYLLKRMESLAADFDKLSCDPKDIPKVQGSGFNHGFLYIA